MDDNGIREVPWVLGVLLVGVIVLLVWAGHCANREYCSNAAYKELYWSVRVGDPIAKYSNLSLTVSREDQEMTVYRSWLYGNETYITVKKGKIVAIWRNR